MTPQSEPGALPGSSGDFEIQVQRLREFAAELAGQAGALRSHRDTLEGLWPVASEGTLLGDFPEAQELAQVHRQALSRVRDLVDELKGLVSFADQIAVEVADRYESADSSAQDSYRKLDLDRTRAVRRLI